MLFVHPISRLLRFASNSYVFILPEKRVFCHVTSWSFTPMLLYYAADRWQHNRNPFQLHSKPQLHLKSCLFCGTPPPGWHQDACNVPHIPLYTPNKQLLSFPRNDQKLFWAEYIITVAVAKIGGCT